MILIFGNIFIFVTPMTGILCKFVLQSLLSYRQPFNNSILYLSKYQMIKLPFRREEVKWSVSSVSCRKEIVGTVVIV